MATLVSSKYSLKSLHEEIGLLDRKLAHLHKFSVFQNDTERDTAAAKMEHKRDLLVRQARAMVEEGIEFHATDLPVSLRTGDASEISPEAVQVSAPPAAPVAAGPQSTKPLSPFSGTVLDGEQALKQYKQKKAKRSPHPAPATPSIEAAAAS